MFTGERCDLRGSFCFSGENENKESQTTAMSYAEKIKETQEALNIKTKEMESYKSMKVKEEEEYEHKIAALNSQLESVTKQKNAIEKNHSTHLQHETKDLKKPFSDIQ